MFKVGDIIEPQEGMTPLTPGAYKLMSLEPDTVHLLRLHVGIELDSVALLHCVTYIPVTMLDLFDISTIDAEDGED